MTTAHRLSVADARRVAVRAQLLTAQRPTGLLDVVRHLTFLQLDPIAAVAPAADLVLWTRLGNGYDPADLRAAVDRRDLVELFALLRPAEDLALYRAEMAVWPGAGPLRPWQRQVAEWVEANDACRRDVLARLEAQGPLTLRELPDTCAVPWQSSGWTNDRNVEKLLGFMVGRGEVAVAGRRGRERTWDLAARVYPDDPVPPLEEALRTRDERRLRAYGIARAKAPEHPMEPAGVGEAGEPAVVEGVKGTWRVDPALLDVPPEAAPAPGGFEGRTALLSPFDRLVHDRKRLVELFGYEYQLEMYKPVAARRWGYYALPVLHGDALVGKVDATADRAGGVLRVDAVHEDVPFGRSVTTAVRRELRDLAGWLGLRLAMPR